MSTRYFHGSSALLQPGDTLVPGAQIGVTVRMGSARVLRRIDADGRPWSAESVYFKA